MVRSWVWLGAFALACGGTVSRSGIDDGGATPASGGTTSTGGTGFGGTTGGTGFGGTGVGGTSAGGIGGTGVGGTAAGGTGAGGTGVGGYTCDPLGNLPSTPGSCDVVDPNDPCQQCIKAKCCTEQMECQGTAPNDPCWWGGPPGPDGYYPGEILCIQDCVVAGGDLATCAAKCTSPGCGTISAATNDFAACLDANCLAECFSY